MNKNCILLLSSLALLTACDQSRPVKNCETYAEAPDPDTTFVDWSAVNGLNYAFATVDKRYPKSAIPNVPPSTKWQGNGWRGERISAQLLLWSDRPVDQIEFDFSPFTAGDGSTMEGSIGTARFVRYVLTDIFASGCGHRKPEDFPVSLSADALDNVDCFDMPGGTTLPVWLSFDIPADAAPGIYTGTLNLHAAGEETKKLDLSIEVLPQTLPPSGEWTFHLDMWQHPSAVARVHGVEVWSEEHWELMKVPMKMLADAGQKVITANLNKDPWNNQCFDPYEDMIRWTKKTDGQWAYDYAVFDRWINFMMDLGVNKLINCYSLLPWNHEIHYIDEATGDTVNISAKPGSPEFSELWTPFLTDFRDHLEAKGWLSFTNIAMDERSPEEMKIALALLEKVVPELGVALADNHKSYRQYPMLKDICVAFGADFDEKDLAFRKENGLISTYYVCCADEFPNVFTFSDPAEAVFMGWYTRATGLDGYLHWSYNSWTENPLTDSRFRTWPAGDTYVIYPDGRSSIRFERIREGIQDAEKIKILREKFMATADTAKLAILEEELAKFNIKSAPDSTTAALVNHGKKVLEDLSR
ncbi:glycoside hydrolase domain-containing protein [Parapedobacter sp.]